MRDILNAICRLAEIGSTKLTVASTVFLLGLGSVSAEPLPTEIRDIVSELFVLEDGFRNQEWDLAEHEVVRMRVLFERARPRLVSAAKTRAQREMIRAVDAGLLSLSNAVKLEDVAATEQSFLVFNKPILGLVELFEYKEHPILFFIDDELAERIDAVTDSDFNFEDLAAETRDMEEQYKILWTFIGTSRNEQVFGSLFDSINQLESAASKKDKNMVADTLSQIQKFNSILRQ